MIPPAASRLRFPFILLLLAALLAQGCALGSAPAAGFAEREAARTARTWRLPDASRIAVLGDLHGDLDATRRALRLAGAIDDGDRWCGGTLVLVQTGDQLDRGDDERAILDLFAHLAEEAARAGGAVHSLNGNHELMNVALDLRYVTPGGFADFADCAPPPAAAATDSLLAAQAPERRGRVAAFRPGGTYARLLAERPVILMLGETVFVHGGVLPAHLAYGVGLINAETRAWLLGEGPRPEITRGADSPVWSRIFSDDVEADDCALLDAVLEELGARRMVVGHSVQEDGVTLHCDGRVCCIDVGMAKHYGGRIEILLIEDGVPRVLGEED